MLDELVKSFDQGRRFLCVDVDAQSVKLCHEHELNAMGPASIAINIETAYVRFAVLTGGATEFRVWHITTMSEASAPLISKWMKEEILTASISPSQGSGHDIRFSYEDAFVAAMIGTMRRFGVESKLLKKIADFLRSFGTTQAMFPVSAN